MPDEGLEDARLSWAETPEVAQVIALQEQINRHQVQNQLIKMPSSEAAEPGPSPTTIQPDERSLGKATRVWQASRLLPCTSRGENEAGRRRRPLSARDLLGLTAAVASNGFSASGARRTQPM